jgi:hypothetical protein
MGSPTTVESWGGGESDGRVEGQKDRSELPAVHRELRSHRAHNKGRASAIGSAD